ncbi:MAG: DUF177 domain-containing protein [Dehalococcoidia bacterium]|nr:DUF177 domain-containing protein [Dehalococcoidia bacterium]
MQINVAQLLKEPVGAMRSYKVDEPAGDNNENYVKGEANLTRTNRGILVTAELTADIKGVCSRCLGPACISTALHLDEEYYPVIDINTGAHLKLEPEAFIIDNNHILDLDEAIRQYIIMATPTKLLCKTDCRGICPVCGHEFTGNVCGHINKPRDHRWDKLVELEKESKV